MFFVVAFFVINANASPAPKFFQEALAVPAECRNQEHDGWCDYYAGVGLCMDLPEMMSEICKSSCGLCDMPPTDDPVDTVQSDDPADEYVGNWKVNPKTSEYVVKCEKLSPSSLECTGSDAAKSKLRINDSGVFFDALKDGFEPVMGNLVKHPDEDDEINFGSDLGVWVRADDPADEYVGNWNDKTSKYVWKCDKLSPSSLECTGSDAAKCKLRINDSGVFFDALKDGFEPVMGNEDEDEIDFGSDVGVWIRQAEEATVQEVPRAMYPY